MKNYLAEFIGTFALVFCGTGAVIVNSLTNQSLGLLGISVTFGIVITTIIYCFGSISGAHINPAVTIALVIGNKIPKNSILGYITAQVLGAFAASFLLLLIFPETKTLGQTTPQNGALSSIIIEFILTFFLMLTILKSTSTKESSKIAGIIIGSSVISFILFSGPISGGSFNPARSLAPAVISGEISTLWIYISAPILGAVSAMSIWKFIYNKN
ncbi:MIP/aquaporin family protein [Tenacibaculum sp. ZS6-P6]|uniref:MIP/aquaporin family protein n=1 Tax=Tenacibaculum sp. ZS6-P6 TaxID=3447503 RepID=UPI003F989522